MSRFGSLEDAECAMEDAGGFLIEDVRRIIGTLLNEEEHGFVAGDLVQLWFALVPPGHFGPEIEPRELHEAFGKDLKTFTDAVKARPDAGGRILLEHGRQPQMVEALAAQLLRDRKELPEAAKFRDESNPLMLLILKTVIAVLRRPA
jgi:hypothetical protein